VAQGWAWILLARGRTAGQHNDPRSEIAAWPQKNAHPLGYVGAALGLQDRWKK
jgi:hypothetical protein